MPQMLSRLTSTLCMWIYCLPTILYDYFYPLLAMFPFVIVLTLAVSWHTYQLYTRDLSAALQHYRTPRNGQKAMSDKPFRTFMLQCMTQWHYAMLSSVSIVLAVTINLNLEATQMDIQKHLILQILAVSSMTQALAALFLSLLYMDNMGVALSTYGHTLMWVEGAISASESTWLSTAAVLTMPTAFSAGAIITFAAYRVVSGVICMMGPEDITWIPDDGTHQGMVVAAVLYMVFVIVQTAFAAKVFIGLKNSAGPTPQIGS